MLQYIDSLSQIKALIGYIIVYFLKLMLICRQGTCERVAKERGYTIIPPYDHCDVIGGQVILVDLWLK